MQAAAAPILPAAVTAGFVGTAQAFQDSRQGLLLLVLAIAVVYTVMADLAARRKHRNAPALSHAGLAPAEAPRAPEA